MYCRLTYKHAIKHSRNLLQAVDGPIPSVDAFIELLLVVDVSPAAAAAAEAAAAPQPRLPPAPRLAPPPGAALFGDAGARYQLLVGLQGPGLTGLVLRFATDAVAWCTSLEGTASGL